MSDTAGKPISCRAAVAWEVGKPLCIETVEVAPPKAHEVRVKVLFNALCHSDAHALDGVMPSMFPLIVGHEATGIVESVGEGVTEFQPGDHVIPLYMPQCGKCEACHHPETNICDTMKVTELSGPMPDGTTRFTCKGQNVYHFMGTSTFSEYTVVTDTRLTKINPEAPMEKMCLLGCGVATGYGAALNTAKVRPGDSVAVWGLGAVGLSAVMGARTGGAKRIVAIDMNPKKFEYAKTVGATDCINPKDCPEGTPFVAWLLGKFGPFDRTIECIGNIQCMKQAVECARKGWGRTAIIGVAPHGQELPLLPFHLLVGKTITGSCFGDWKSKTDVPKLVEDALEGKLDLDTMITHTFDLTEINHALELLHSGECLRAVLTLSKE